MVIHYTDQLFHSLIRRLVLERQRPVFIRVFIELLQAIFAAERNRLAFVLRVNRFSNVSYRITGNRADCVYRFLGGLCGWCSACARGWARVGCECAKGKRRGQRDDHLFFHGMVLVQKIMFLS